MLHHVAMATKVYNFKEAGHNTLKVCCFKRVMIFLNFFSVSVYLIKVISKILTIILDISLFQVKSNQVTNQ